MSEHHMPWSLKHSTDPAVEPEVLEPKDARRWDPDEDASAYPTDGGSPAASKNKKKPLGDWPIGLGG